MKDIGVWDITEWCTVKGINTTISNAGLTTTALSVCNSFYYNSFHKLGLDVIMR